jgi:hypothetical protein
MGSLSTLKRGPAPPGHASIWYRLPQTRAFVRRGWRHRRLGTDWWKRRAWCTKDRNGPTWGPSYLAQTGGIEEPGVRRIEADRLGDPLIWYCCLPPSAVQKERGAMLSKFAFPSFPPIALFCFALGTVISMGPDH